MLELRTYTKDELAAIIETNDNQGIRRKLQRNQIEFTTSGFGRTLKFEIKAIHDPFKIYALWDLKVNPHADFMKIRNLFYFFFCYEGFRDLPLIQMADMLEENNCPVSRPTITKWINHLESIDYVTSLKSDCLYYRIYKDKDRKVPVEITKEKYCEAWKIYFKVKSECNDSGEAYFEMYHFLHGHPYKKPKVYNNVFYQKDIEFMIELLNDSFLNNPPKQLS